MAKRHTKIKSISITKRGQQEVVSISLGGNAERIIGVRVSSIITGIAIQALRHYMGVFNAQSIGSINGSLPLTLANFPVMRNKVISAIVSASATQSIYYARPTEIEGTPNFKLNGVDEPFNAPETVSVVDSETNATTSYDVYQSASKGLSGTLYVY